MIAADMPVEVFTLFGCHLQSNSNVDIPGTVEKHSSFFKLALFSFLVVLWLLFDALTKNYLDSGSFALGESIGGGLDGLFTFRLVHNTGMAWGLLENATVALGLFSIAVCAFLIGYVVYMRKQIGYLELFGMALLVSGGLGNAIDRFARGYVVDFIEFTFVHFPVFNIADIGVTCGVVLVLLAFLFERKIRA